MNLEAKFDHLNERLDQIERKIESKNKPAPDGLIPIQKFCKDLDITEATAIAWQKAGLIRCVYIGRKKFVPSSFIDQLIQSQIGKK